MSVPSPGAAGVAEPSSAGHALAMAVTGLSWLARADAASLPAAVQADALRDLERLSSFHAAAQAKVLAGFTAQRGFEEDGQGSPRTWLAWQTRVTPAAARTATGWMRRLDDHPDVAAALADGVISVSWARQVTDWTGRLPIGHRRDADVILLAAAAGGADLLGLAELAEEIRRRTAGPDRDRDDGFTDRGLYLDTTFGGAGRVRGDLTPRCTAALQGVLDALGKKHGPEDTRTWPQRQHDALEEACRRLLGSSCLPDRAGQPVRLNLNMNLDQLLNGIGKPGQPWLLPGDSEPPADRGPVLPGAWAGPGDDCDAALAPIVTGRVDHDLLDQLAGRLAAAWAGYDPGRAPCAGSGLPGCAGPHGHDDPARAGQDDAAGHDDDGLDRADRKTAARRRDDEQRRQQERLGRSKAAAREVILRQAVALLSGPGGLASWLRTGKLPAPAGSVSLPLDVGTVTELVPPHLRRAITARDRHCAAPGCDTPPAACHAHHIIPRSQGGTTSLTNCLLLCSFHHLILIHRWGWTITLNADGTTTARSPAGRVLHSHGPPLAA